MEVRRIVAEFPRRSHENSLSTGCLNDKGEREYEKSFGDRLDLRSIGAGLCAKRQRGGDEIGAAWSGARDFENPGRELEHFNPRLHVEEG